MFFFFIIKTAVSVRPHGKFLRNVIAVRLHQKQRRVMAKCEGIRVSVQY